MITRRFVASSESPPYRNFSADSPGKIISTQFLLNRVLPILEPLMGALSLHALSEMASFYHIPHPWLVGSAWAATLLFVPEAIVLAGLLVPNTFTGFSLLWLPFYLICFFGCLFFNTITQVQLLLMVGNSVAIGIMQASRVPLLKNTFLETLFLLIGLFFTLPLGRGSIWFNDVLLDKKWNIAHGGAVAFAVLLVIMNILARLTIWDRAQVSYLQAKWIGATVGLTLAGVSLGFLTESRMNKYQNIFEFAWTKGILLHWVIALAICSISAFLSTHGSYLSQRKGWTRLMAESREDRHESCSTAPETGSSDIEHQAELPARPRSIAPVPSNVGARLLFVVALDFMRDVSPLGYTAFGQGMAPGMLPSPNLMPQNNGISVIPILAAVAAFALLSLRRENIISPVPAFLKGMLLPKLLLLLCSWLVLRTCFTVKSGFWPEDGPLPIRQRDWGAWVWDEHVLGKSALFSAPLKRNFTNEFSVVVTNSANGDTDWLYAGSDRHGIEVVNYDRHNKSHPYFIPNLGREALPYVAFVAQHYDVLPEWTFLIHGHREALHQQCDMLEALVDRKAWMTTNNQTKVWALFNRRLSLGGEKHVNYIAENCNDYHAPATHAFKFLFPDERMPDPLPVVTRAQFAVHRTVLMSRPRSFWINLAGFIMFTPLGHSWPYDEWHVGFAMEMLWLKIFGVSQTDVDALPENCPN